MSHRSANFLNLFKKEILGAKPATNFNPAALELSGCLTAYSTFLIEVLIKILIFNSLRIQRAYLKKNKFSVDLRTSY